MTLRNDEVAKAWRQGREAQSNRMSTDGDSLYSYNLLIGYTRKGYKILKLWASYGGDGRFVSMTTSGHVGISLWHADLVIHPETGKRLAGYGHIADNKAVAGFLGIPVQKELQTELDTEG